MVTKEKINIRIFRDGAFKEMQVRSIVITKKLNGYEEIDYKGGKWTIIRENGLAICNVRLRSDLEQIQPKKGKTNE